MKIIQKFLFVLAFFYQTSTLGMYLTPRQERIGRTLIQRYVKKNDELKTKDLISIPPILANNSQFIKNIPNNLKPTDPATGNTLLRQTPDITQKAIDQLAKIYREPNVTPVDLTQEPEQLQLLENIRQTIKNTMLSSLNIPIEDLVQAINAETFLNIDPYNHNLNSHIIAMLKQQPLANLTSLHNLNPDRALNIMHQLIKDEQIDANLLRPYNNWLANNPKIIENNQVGKNAAYEDLLFFNDSIKIYGPIWGAYGTTSNEPYVYDEIIIKQNGRNNKKISLDDFLYEIKIKVNQNSTHCIVHSRDFDATTIQPQLWNIATDNPEKIVLDQNITACCFTHDQLCTANKDGTIQLCNLSAQECVPLTQFTLDNEHIIQLECHIDKNKAATAAALTNKGTIYIFKQNNIETFKLSQKNSAIKDINLNALGDNLFILFEYEKIANYLFLSLPFSIDQQPKQISIPVGMWPHLCKSHWTKDNTLITISYNARKKEEGFLSTSYKFISRFVAINPNTLNFWELSLHPDAVSYDGNNCIKTESSTFSTTTKQITLCDSDINDALAYLNTTQSYETKDNIQRLFGTLLLYKIYKQKKQHIILDDTEKTIYSNDLPKSIQTILTETDIIIAPQETQSSEQQIQQKKWYTPFLSLKNSATVKWNDWSKKLTEYRSSLLVNKISTIAIGGLTATATIAALYKYLSKQQ